MTAEVASASVALLPTFKGGAQAIQKELGGPVGEAGKRSGEDYGNGVVGSFTKFAGPIAAVFASAKVVEFLKDSAAAASDLNEAGTAGGQVFGDAYSAIEAFADTAATRLGQSKLEALDGARTFGVFGKAAGLAGTDLVGFSTGLVGLSGDLASFYNTSPEQAIDAVGAALRGESEPIRQYGVLLDDATLKARALSSGLIQASVDEVKVTTARRALSDATEALQEAQNEYGDGSEQVVIANEKIAAAQKGLDDALGGSVQALTPAQRTMAAYQEILAQTGVAQGDFGRTSDGLANQQRVLAAQSEDFKARFGEALLPLFTQVTTALNTDLFPALETFLPIVQDIFSTAVPQLLDTGESLLPIVESGMTLAKTVLPIVGAAFSSMLGVAEPVLGFFTDLDPYVVAAGFAFIGFVKLRPDILGMLDKVGEGIGGLNTPFDGLNRKIGGIPDALGRVTSFLGGPWGLAIGAGATVLGSFVLNEVAEAKARVDDLTTSFDDNTGAITENTRAVVFKSLQESGAVQGAKDLGINLETLTDAALGSASATAQVRSVTNGVADEITAWSEAGKDLTETQRANLGAVGSVIGAIGTQNKAIVDARQNWADNAEAQGVARTANEDFAAAVQAASQSIASNGATLDENTAQGLANKDALQKIADQTTSLIDTSLGLQDSTYMTQRKFEDARQAFIDTATQMNLPIDQAKALADAMLAVPGQKVIDVVANTDDAMARIDILATRVDGLNNAAVRVLPEGVQSFGYAGGGTVSGPGTSKSDSVVARLSVGEEVIQEPHASKHRALLKAINAGLGPIDVAGAARFADGGTVGQSTTVLPAGTTRITQQTFHVAAGPSAAEIAAAAKAADDWEAKVFSS